MNPKAALRQTEEEAAFTKRMCELIGQRKKIEKEIDNLIKGHLSPVCPECGSRKNVHCLKITKVENK